MPTYLKVQYFLNRIYIVLTKYLDELRYYKSQFSWYSRSESSTETLVFDGETRWNTLKYSGDIFYRANLDYYKKKREKVIESKLIKQ
jgi:hypothetical protein